MDTDEVFFAKFPRRQSRIREPFGNESESDFLSLGDHNRDRRRIIAWKVPQNINIPYKHMAGKVIRVPFLAFADEEIANDDETIMPILNEIMMEGAKEHGVQIPRINSHGH